MSEFSVTFPRMQAANSQNRAVIRQLAAAAGQVESIRSGLTIEIRQRSWIDSRMKAVARDLETYTNSLTRLCNTGDAVFQLYQRTESGLLGKKPEHFRPARPGAPGGGESESVLETLLENLWEFAKREFNFKLDSVEALGKLFSYLERDTKPEELKKLLEQLKGAGLDLDSEGVIPVLGKLATLAKDLMGLADGNTTWGEGVTVAGGGVSLIGSVLKLLDDSDGLKELGGEIGAVGSGLNAIGAFLDAFDSEGKPFEQVVGGYTDAVKTTISAADSIATAFLGTTPIGHVAMSAIKGSVDAVGQLFVSWDEYTGDGDLSMGDVGNIVVDVAAEGVYSICNELTFGGLEAVLDFATGGNMDYGDILADGLRDIGGAIGDTVSDWAGDAISVLGDWFS